MRLRRNFTEGVLGSGVTDSATTMVSLGFTSIPLILAGSGDIMAITIDPGPDGSREIVHITAHDSASATVTVLRGQEGSTAVAHDVDTAWSHAATADDFVLPDPWDAVPVSPSAYDDEFDGSSSASWANTPTAAVSTSINGTKPGALVITAAGSNSNLVGLVQTAPATPFTVETKIVGSISLVALWLLENNEPPRFQP